MGGFFSSPPPAPDTSAMDAQRAEASAAAQKQKDETAARLRALQGGRSGVRSLLYAGEEGITPDQPGLKKTLG